MQNLTGEIIITTDGKKYKLGKLAGYGAQGVVYEDESGNKMIKLYYPTGSNIVDEDIFDRKTILDGCESCMDRISHSSNH